VTTAWKTRRPLEHRALVAAIRRGLPWWRAPAQRVRELFASSGYEYRDGCYVPRRGHGWTAPFLLRLFLWPQSFPTARRRSRSDRFGFPPLTPGA
jgi:hypothetical protein